MQMVMENLATRNIKLTGVFWTSILRIHIFGDQRLNSLILWSWSGSLLRLKWSDVAGPKIIQLHFFKSFQESWSRSFLWLGYQFLSLCAFKASSSATKNAVKNDLDERCRRWAPSNTPKAIQQCRCDGPCGKIKVYLSFYCSENPSD